jgi:O-antigen ligase
VEIPAALFVGWALVNIAFSQDPAESLHHAKRFLLLPALWLYAGAARRPGASRRLIIALGLGAAGVALVGIVQYLRGPGGLIGRANLVQGYMTAGGLMMLCGLTLVAFLLRRRDSRARLPLLLALMAVLVALVFTYTRNAWLGFAAGTLLLLLLQRPQAAPVFAVLAVLAVVVAPASFRARMLSSFNPEHHTNVQRVIMWKTGWRMLQDHPLTGVGDLDLKRIYRSYHRGEDVEIKGHLHSNPVMFAAIWGWPGLVLALAFLISLPWQLFKRWRAWRRLGDRAPPLAMAWTLSALAAWLGFMVGGFFEWNFGDAEVALLLWTLVGLGLGPTFLTAPSAEEAVS